MRTVRPVLNVSLFLLFWIIAICWAGCGFRADYDQRRTKHGSRSFRHSRIVGGKDALPGEWPWMVSLQVWNQPFCGGAILSTWWILSAAHCFMDPVYRSEHLRVEVGATVLQKNKEALDVQKVIIHPWYKESSLFINDIALLLLSTPIQYSVLKTPICLPPAGIFRTEDWHTCYITGWGTLMTGQPGDNKHLQKVEMALIKQNLCKTWYSTLTQNMLCARFEDESQHSCKGDSGGPLVCKSWKDDLWYEVGIVSWGEGCARKQHPSVYTRVSSYVNWIIKATTDARKPFVLDKWRTVEVDEDEEEAEPPLDTFATASVIAALDPARFYLTFMTTGKKKPSSSVVIRSTSSPSTLRTVTTLSTTTISSSTTVLFT